MDDADVRRRSPHADESVVLRLVVLAYLSKRKGPHSALPKGRVGEKAQRKKILAMPNVKFVPQCWRIPLDVPSAQSLRNLVCSSEIVSLYVLADLLCAHPS